MGQYQSIKVKPLSSLLAIKYMHLRGMKMQTFFKKSFIGFLLLSLFALLAACGGGEGASGKETTDGNKNSEGKTGTGGTLEISVQSDYIEYVNEIIPAFEEEHGVTVNVIERDMSEALDALPLDGPSGLGPDILIAPYDRIAIFGQQGHLAEVTLPDDGRYDELDHQQVTVDGKSYGYPMMIESLVLYYNKDLLDEPPATFDDLEALTNDERYALESEPGTSTAFLVNWLDFYYAYGLFSGFGAYVFGNNGTDPTDIGLNTPEAVEAIEYIAHWYQNIWPQGMLDASTAYNFVDERFITGKAAAVITGPWSEYGYRDAGVNFGVSTIPKLPNGENYKPFAGGKGWIISNYSENKDLAVKFLEYVTNVENQTFLHELKGEVPANQIVRQEVANSGGELAKAVIEQYNSSVPMPNIPEMAEVWPAAQTMIFDVASGNKDARQSADDAVELIKQNIEQKYNN